MTNTLTTNFNETIKQINQLAEAGADIVRVSCPDQDSSLALKKNYIWSWRSYSSRHTFSLQKSYRGSKGWRSLFKN